MNIIKNHGIVIIAVIALLLLTFESPAGGADTGRADKKISFNFVDVDISTVIKFISEITGSNFIFDERVKGKITILTPSKLSVDESFNLFTSILELKGFTIVPSGTKAYKVIPSTMAKQSGSIAPDAERRIDESYITRLMPVEHIKASDAVKFLQPVVSRNGHISSFGPTNQLLVVDSALNVEKIMTILSNIDQPLSFQEAEVNVYPLLYADATELAKVLEGILKGPPAPKRQKASPVVTTPFADVQITPDKATNSLIIVTSPADYQRIAQVIEKLDKKRRQVFVEAMIVEATIEKVKELGSKWRATVQHNDEPVTIGGFGTLQSTDVLDILTGLSGFTLGGLGNFLDIPVSTVNSDGSVSSSTLTVPGFAALFDMSEFRDAINVLSTPQLLTSDNEEAEIVVGENVPFISSSQRDLSTTNTVLSSIERQDVGIRLKITPQITEGNYVKLDIYQEISSVKEDSENVTISVGPTTTKRSTSTSVLVKNEQTVVISGLMEDEDRDELVKTPILGDIPIFGWLFKHKSRTREKTNLLVFITPHIVTESEQLAEITERKDTDFAVNSNNYALEELLLKFRDGVSDEDARGIISQRGASVIRFNAGSGVYHIKLKRGMDVEDAVREFSALPEVLFAEPNYRVTIQKQGQ